jgi:tRNA pseudouridine55 synthase
VIQSQVHGFLVIDKPAGITSRAAVDRARRWLPRGTRVGHAGTLDPLATGVLVLCVGNASRLTEYVQRLAKTYRGGIILGARSDTDDADGTVTLSPDVVPPTLAQIAGTLPMFLGAIEQVPPAFSAARLSGRRAYDLARAGKEVNLAPRVVRIDAIDILRYEYPLLELQVRCGKGTYIRSLARDLGQQLGTGGYVASLRRTRIGCFDIADTLALDAETATARASLLPLARGVSELPHRTLSPAEVVRVRQGQALPAIAGGSTASEIALFDQGGELVAVGMIDPSAHLVRPGKVLASL